MKIEIVKHSGVFTEEKIIDDNGNDIVEKREVLEIKRSYECSEIERDSLMRRVKQTAEMMSMISGEKYKLLVHE